MSSRAVTIAGYLVFLGTGLILTALAHRRGSRIPPMSELFSWVMRTRTGRIAVVAWWAWIGLHLFAK